MKAGRHLREFRRATASDRELLDEMTLAGTRHWGHHKNYPEAYAGLVAQLTAESGPENNPVFVLVEDGEVLGFYELRDQGDYVELLRMFMLGDAIGRGYGRLLWDHAVDQARGMHSRMLIMSDPAAVGFYAAMGATFEKEVQVAPGFALAIYWYDLTAV